MGRPRWTGGGAWAVANGYTAKIDPEAWAIVDDRLYLNYSKDVQTQWSQDVPGNITKADANWPASAPIWPTEWAAPAETPPRGRRLLVVRALTSP